MPITFTTAPIVAAGDAITSTQTNLLADAFLDRMRSGIGDPTWRIHWYAINLCRQFRNPAENGLSFPANAEWQQYYIHQAPGTEWVGLGSPGDYEGVNLASVLPAFVHGNPSVESESDRLSYVDLDPGSGSVAAYWELGKRQRGGYDPATGDQSTPALAAAQSHYKIVQPAGSFHGKSYGGWLPRPTKSGDCGDEDETPNYLYRFTSLVEGVPDKEYIGSCPYWTPGYAAGHVQWIWSGPLSYYIYLGGWTDEDEYGNRYFTGTIEILPKAEYIEGPYSAGGALAWTEGQQIERLIQNPFIREYRGIAAQRLGEYSITEIAFSFEDFFTSQYLLAPAKATTLGPDVLDVTYPVLTFAAQTAGAESTSHTLTAGFVLGGVLAEATGLLEETSVQILDGSTVLATLTLTPDDEGDASAVHWFLDGPTPATVNAKLVSAATGEVTVEVAELLEYKPQNNDAYLLLRMASCLPAIDDVDRRGIDEGQSLKIWEDYSTLGCIVPLNGSVAVEAQVNQPDTNAAHDAARRFVRKHTRIVRRQEFTAYELDSEGRSVLHFRRYAYGDSKADWAEDIVGQIKHTATAEGRTNEWLMFVQTKVYNPNAGTVFWDSSYSDYFAFNNRCHFYSPWITKEGNPEMMRHVAQGPPYQDVVLAPEAPTGYNFAEQTNLMTSLVSGDERREHFYKSCQIYQPDYEIETAEAYLAGSVEMVKVTFKTRFAHCDEAPDAITSDPSTWDVDALKSEPYRTDENALREYIVDQYNASRASVKTGDTAFPSGSVGAGALNAVAGIHPIYGSAYPHFFFTKLPGKVYEDGNDTPEKADTVCDVDDFLQLEFYLRAMCEGYVDGVTTTAYACENVVESVFDYTFENLCYQAFDGRWLSVLPESVRGDLPQGFGPLPNTLMYADVFNQFSSCVNMLTKARVMLPHKLEVYQRDYEDRVPVAYNIGDDSKFIKTSFQPDSASTPVSPESWEWVPATDIVSSSVASYDGTFTGSTPNMRTYQQNMSWRFSLQDPDAINAIPEAWRDSYATIGGGFVGRWEHLVIVPYATAGAGPTECSDIPGFWVIGSTNYEVGSSSTNTETCQVFGSGGTLDVGTPGPGTFWRGTTGLGSCGGASEISDGVFPISTATGILTISLV